MEQTNRAAQHDAQARLGLAINALDAVRDLCCEASNSQPRPATLGLVDADHFSALLGILVNEMRDAHEIASA